MRAKCFCLQKLQHGRRQCFRYAVDFVDEQDAFFQPCFFHFVIYCPDDFTHGVFCDSIFLAAVVFVADEGQPHGALTGVVGDAVCHQPHAAFPCHLFHDGSFADTRRTHEQQGTLPHHRDFIFSVSILCQISGNGMLDFFLCLFDIHSITPCYTKFPNLLCPK